MRATRSNVHLDPTSTYIQWPRLALFLWKTIPKQVVKEEGTRTRGTAQKAWMHANALSTKAHCCRVIHVFAVLRERQMAEKRCTAAHSQSPKHTVGRQDSQPRISCRKGPAGRVAFREEFGAYAICWPCSRKLREGAPISVTLLEVRTFGRERCWKNVLHVLWRKTNGC